MPKQMNDLRLIFSDKSIRDQDGFCVMHKWETPMMKAHVDLICSSDIDVLEFGFGMGISANFIQEYRPNRHTICESHPDILVKLREWAKDRPSVNIIEGYWIDNVNLFEKYDAIFYDTHVDKSEKYFFENFTKWLKPGGKMTYFNPKWMGRKKYFNDSQITYTNLRVDKNHPDMDRKEYGRFEDDYLVPLYTK